MNVLQDNNAPYHTVQTTHALSLRVQDFQNTEIGLIPRDWEVKAIETFAEIKTGSRNTENKVEGGLYPFFVRSQKVERINTFACDEEAILTAGDGVGVGKVFHYINGKFDYHQRVYKISNFQTSQVYGKYFFEYFKHNFFNEVMKYTAKSSVDSVRMDMIAKMLIPLPPLPEQTRIAEILQDQDALISRQEEAIEKQKMLKQATMQTLLQPKEGWEVRRLGDIVDVFGGGTPSTFNSSFWNGNINWFTPTEIGSIKYVNESARKITKEGFANSSGKMLPIGTVLLTSRAGIGDLGILTQESCTNQGFQSLVAKSNTDNEFVYYLMSTLKPILLQNASGSTFLEISPNKLKQIQINVPKLAEQTRIATILSDIDAEIEAMEAEVQKQRALKEGLMQELLTGRRRLI